MANSISKNVGSTVTAVASEQNAKQGNVVIVPANLQWTVSDPTVATLTANADGSASILGIAPGTVTVTVVDTAFKLTATGDATFAADTTATSISINFS